MALKYPISVLNFPSANKGQTVTESVKIYQDRVSPCKNSYSVTDDPFKFRPHGDPTWYENKPDTYMLSNTILELGVAPTGFGAIVDIFETASQIHVLTYMFDADLSAHKYNLLVFDRADVNAAIHNLATPVDVEPLSFLGTEPVDYSSSRRHFAQYDGDLFIVLDYEITSGERVCRVYRNSFADPYIKQYFDETHELRDIEVIEDLLIMMFENPSTPEMQIVMLWLADTDVTQEYTYSLSHIDGPGRSKGSLAVFQQAGKGYIVAVLRCAMILEINPNFTVTPTVAAPYEFNSFPNMAIHTGVHDTRGTIRNLHYIGGDNTLGQYEFYNCARCEGADQLEGNVLQNEINIRDFDFEIVLHMNEDIETMLTEHDTLFRLYEERAGIIVRLELGPEVEAPFTARLVVEADLLTVATSDYFPIHGYDTWWFTVKRKFTSLGAVIAMTVNGENLTVTLGDAAQSSIYMEDEIAIRSRLGGDTYYHHLNFTADNKKVTSMLFKGGITDGLVEYSNFVNSFGLIRNVLPGIQKQCEHLIDLRFSYGGTEGFPHVYALHGTDSETGPVSAILKYNTDLAVVSDSGVLSSNGATLFDVYYSRTLVVSQQDGRVYFGAMSDGGSISTVNRIGLDLSFKANARSVHFSFVSNTEGLFNSLFTNTATQGDLPLFAVCEGEARTIPYGMIVLDEGLRDYYRMASEPVTRDILTYRKATKAELNDGDVVKFLYNGVAGTFVSNALGRFVRETKTARIQTVSQAYTAYIDTPDLYYSSEFATKEEPLSLYALVGVGMQGVEMHYTLDSNYRYNDDTDIKRCGELVETGSLGNTAVYAHASKQVEVVEIETIDGRTGRCVKFRLSEYDTTEPDSDPVTDNWRVFELRFTPSNLFVIDGE